MHFIKATYILLLVLSTGLVQAQQDSIPSEYDQKYREDQFYLGLTYNILVNVPSGVEPRGVSGGVNFGYLRDMPINERRNIAIAVGAGISLDRFGQNLFIGEEPDETTIFTVIDEDVNFDTNRFAIATIEAPIEFRWRTSTAESYKFWRVYLGLRLGYSYYYRNFFKQTDNEVSQTDIPEFDPFRSAISLSFGYNTFNLYASYTINPFFKDATTTDGQQVDFRTVRVGLIFYIL